MSKEHRRDGKKIYQKPEVKAIDLAADEVLAVGCKMSTTPDAKFTALSNCLIANCFALGS